MRAAAGAHLIERAGSADLMFLALQHSTVPEQFGVVLVLEAVDGFDPRTATGLLAERIRAVPRMRQRILSVPPGCGRAIWVDDPTFSVDRHIDVVVCPSPGDRQAVLDVAAALLMEPLPWDRPLWAARFVTGLAGGQVALVVVLQHGLADGMGGLAVLGALMDGAPPSAGRPFPAERPTRAELAAEAFATRVRALASIPRLLRQSRPRRRLRPRIGRAATCSLLRPTGPRRRLAVATVSMEAIHAAARRRGATVNDALVSAIAGALHAWLGRRGEYPVPLVIGVPVAIPRNTSEAAAGNALTQTRVRIAGGGDPGRRLTAVAATMRERKGAAMRPVTGAVAAPVVRAMIALGIFGPYMRRQRYLHTVITNVRGPGHTLTLGGARVISMVPMAVGGGGNVTVTFTALSYAGQLTVSVTADPATSPDLTGLTTLLQAELDALIGR